MSLPCYTAVQFRRPMERGLNRPFLVLAEEVEGEGVRTPLVVKTTAGYQNRPECMVKELFALLLARCVGLYVPDPVLVQFPKGFAYGAVEFPDYADLIRKSPGWNLATIHLGESWKPWTKTSPPRSIDREELESAYCFDAMVQNTDRTIENPNLLWKRDQLALLDFDKSFGYLRTHQGDTRPWRSVLSLMNLRNHCFFGFLPQKEESELFGDSLWENFLEWRVASGKDALTTEIGNEVPDPGVDLPLLEDYLTNLENHAEDFFRHLTERSMS